MPLILRLSQGSALTYQQLDDNFTFITSSFVPNSATGSFAITGSNNFSGSQYITGSLTNGASCNSAIGLYSHAEGDCSTAIGTSSHAEGYFTTAVGIYSHAEGKSTNNRKCFTC